MPATIRSFMAIELPEEVQAALTALQNRLKAMTPAHTVRWTAPQSIHLTLHFLGDLTAGQVQTATEILETTVAAYPPFALTVSGMGCFPNTRRPRIVWAGVSGQTEPLIRLHQELGQKLKEIEYRPDKRPYSPHLTLGRVKDRLPARQLTQLGQVLEQEQAAVSYLANLPVSEISLMRSELKPAGAVYTQLTCQRLASSD